VTAPVTSTVHRVVSTVHQTVRAAVPDDPPTLSLPGLSVPASENLGPVTVGTSRSAATAGTTPVVRSAAAASRVAHVADPAMPAPQHVAGPAHVVPHATPTVAGSNRQVAEWNAPTLAGLRLSHAEPGLPHRQPVNPIAPTAPPAPAGGASTGSGANANSSGSVGSSAPAALDADADAPLHTLGTVDPTDASMARSVSKRPSTSPD
jgi:hypothetical protein